MEDRILMSGKQVKRYKKVIIKTMKSQETGIIKKALSDLREYPFLQRVKFCWWLLWKKN